MPTFPRTTGAKPRLITPPRFPEGLTSWGRSGKGQFRAVTNMGRQWTETYPQLNGNLASVRALIAAINQGLREGTIWDVAHLYYNVLLGVGGGSPLVNGANQVGSNLVVDGIGGSITNWLRAGDIIQVAGCAVVFDVTAAVNSAAGAATIPISPPIFTGKSPADNAVVTINPANILFKAVLAQVSDFPEMDVNKIVSAGMTLTWREQPQ